MDYQKKIEYAEKVAQELQGQKTSDQIKADLKADGLYEPDIIAIFISAKKMVSENYKPKIREFLLEDKDIVGSAEFNSLDKDMLEILIEDEKRNIGLEERQKMTKMIKEGHNADDVLAKVDTRFVSQEKAKEQLAKLTQTKKQNSGTGRMLSIGGGIGLILLTGVLALTINRIFYVLPIMGLVMIVKGFLTERMEYEE